MKLALRVVAFLLLVVVAAGVIFYRYPLWVGDQHTRFHLWRLGVKSEYVDAGGYRLHYFEAGPAGGGTPLVLVHGLGARGEDWGPMIPALAAQGFHVYVPDLLAIEHIVMERHPDWAHYHQNKTPETYHEAQVSLPYSVAIALEEGAALFDQYRNDKLKREGVLHAAQVMEFRAEPSLPRGVSCRMTMIMKDGSSYVAQVDDPKGSIGNPMSDAELRFKFDSLARPVIGDAGAARLADAVAAVEASTVQALMQLTASA